MTDLNMLLSRFREMMSEEGGMDLSGPCPIWEEGKARPAVICYRSQLPMMPKRKRGFLVGHATN